MPKYLKLYEAFVNEASSALYVLDVSTYSSATVRWQKYSDQLQFAEFALGRIWGITDAATVTSKNINFYATTNSADSGTINNLTAIGGTRTSQQDGTYPGNPTYNYKGQVAFAIKSSELSKLETIGQILSGTYVGSAGTSGTSGTAGTAGTSGTSGATGATGAAGTSGTSGTSGGALTITGNSPGALTAGDLVYLDTVAGSNWYKAQANAQVSSIALIGISQTTTGGGSITIQLLGQVSSQQHNVTGTQLGVPVFIDPAVAGAFTDIVPSNPGEFVRGVGWITDIAAGSPSTVTIILNPDVTWIKL